jgi:hypothetical protein
MMIAYSCLAITKQRHNENSFILVFSITSGGSTNEGEVGQTFATNKNAWLIGKKLIETHRKTHPQDRPGEGIIANCKQVKW